MNAPSTIGAGKPTLRIRGTSYPVLLPTLRDPRLHLAAVIVSLQILGQVAFEFRLSIAQILVSLLTCAVLEMGIAFRRQHVILWPASALLTGNGVAFILRVPGTEHGDWWSMHGWWIFAGTAAVSLLSKHLIQFRGGHIFNPSNFGLVLCFLLLGPEHADPLEFWWGPMSFWLALALAIIVGGGFAILRRLRLLHIAITFWVTFVASIAVLAASGHDMTARWHVGPVSDWYFWRVLAFSPEILVFLFFMITDPKTIPGGKRRAPGLRGLDRLAGGAAARPADDRVRLQGGSARLAGDRLRGPARARAARRSTSASGAGRVGSGRAAGVAALAGAVAFVSLLVVAGIPARSSAEAHRPPRVVVGRARRRHRQAGRRDRADRRANRPADRAGPRRRSRERVGGAPPPRPRARDGGSRRRPPRRAVAADRRSDAEQRTTSRATRVKRVLVSLEPGDGQAPPTVVATVSGTVQRGGAASRLAETFELVLKDGRYLITAVRGSAARSAPPAVRSETLGGVRLQDVAARVGLDFRQSAFRFRVTNEPDAMMGGGLCWLDYDDDGWLDLYVVNAYADDEYERWTGERRPASERALPQRRGAIRGRQPRLGRRPAAPRQRLCCRGLQPGRAHGPLRHDRRLQRRHRRLRRAALGARRRHLHRRRPRCRDQHARLALGRRGRRRQRRRAARSIRGRLRRRQHADPGLVRGLPLKLRRCP